MISEKDKQAILNGAYGVTRDGRKAKFIGFNHRGEPVFEIETESGKYSDWKLYYFLNNFHLVNNGKQPEDIVGLWQDEPEPFDLERALRGYPVILRGGLKAFIKFKLPKTSTSTPYIGYYENEVHNCVEHCWDENGMCEPISRNETSLDIVGMWKEPEPLSSNSLQLPKPLTKLPNESTTLHCLSLASDGNAPYGKLRVSYFPYCQSSPSSLDEIYLKNGRLYRTKDEVIQIIEAITGKPYVE